MSLKEFHGHYLLIMADASPVTALTSVCKTCQENWLQPSAAHSTCLRPQQVHLCPEHLQVSEDRMVSADVFPSTGVAGHLQDAA